jgi:hypothetical protein
MKEFLFKGNAHFVDFAYPFQIQGEIFQPEKYATIL